MREVVENVVDLPRSESCMGTNGSKKMVHKDT